ncbi:hypothetical protein H0E87_008281 [Populus deltoides]|uniref:Malectin-like domain-containing protein n=1 Tax=Populus deltoides TaxID=3696 RepID=A0A8T2Z090_POPDE|nr:hypothetical protein H0E87_008281 [Populus deltoides]
MAFLLVLLFALLSSPSIVSAGGNAFKPADEFLINCGAKNLASFPDGRIFKTDKEAQGYLQTKQDILVSIPAANVSSPLYLSARIFKEDATYAFTLKSAGWHWVRLHLFPMNNTEFDLRTATFSVNTDKYALLHNFNTNNDTQAVLKEYLINMTDPNFSIHFIPLKNSAAFINAIEVVSAPDILISDQATNLFPVNNFAGLNNFGYEVVYRLNMGGPLITSENDTLSRRWVPDKPYLKHEALAKSASVPTSSIKYGPGISSLIAPATVYASAEQMADSETRIQNFNLTWNFVADATFSYVVRMHFCDIVSKSLNDLYFNVYLNGKMAISGLDLSSIKDELAVSYFKDFVVDASLMSNGLAVEVGPMGDETGTRNAILNGLEVFKMSSKVNSLDGVFGVDGKMLENHKAVVYVGFGLMFGAFVGLGAMLLKWHKRPQDWQKRNSFSSWLLPVHAGDHSFMSSKTSLGSHKTNFYSSTLGLGRFFSLSELQEATKNFDSSEIIGVGGFGNVYIGMIDDSTKVAVKRGNPQSEQGITEFQTEIQMLSKPALNPQLPREQVNLAEWAMQWKRKGLLEKIIDPCLVGTINPESLMKFAEAAEKCLAEHGVDRPTMGDVLWNLEYALQLQEAFSKGKAEDESKLSAAVADSPVAVATPKAISTSVTEDNKSPAEVHVIDDHSGTAMFSQFAGLNGSGELFLNRRGLSRYYSGKARSFTCIADVRCLEDLKKPERPDPKKRKKYSDRKDLNVPPYPCRRVSCTTQRVPPCVGVRKQPNKPVGFLWQFCDVLPLCAQKRNS